MPTYTKTVNAFLAEEGSLWGIVDALGEEMPGDCSASAIGECQQHLADNGIDKSARTIEDYRITGRYVEASTVAQRKIFRAQSVSTIREFANGGASQEFASQAIRDYLAQTGAKRMPKAAVHGAIRPSQPPRGGSASAPEDWSDQQWQAFDRKVVEAAKTLLTAFNVVQQGLYRPSVEATAQLALVREQDLDSELASLIGR